MNSKRITAVQFQCKALKQSKNYIVVMPKKYNLSDKKWPVLFMFHGRGRNESSLIDDPITRKDLLKTKFVIVLPLGDDNWYINSPVNTESLYNDYIEELIKDAEVKFRISSNPENRGIAGWSMGGYGSTMFVSIHAKEFSVLASVIGLLDFPRSELPDGQSYRVPANYFGSDSRIWADLNPINHADKIKHLKIMIITGEKSFDRTMNENYTAKLRQLKVDFQFITLKGAHTWETIREAIPEVIKFMNKNLTGSIEAN